MTRETWLNGWSRHADTVLLGTMLHCAGCGRERGVTCVVLAEGWEAPEKAPDWPFDRDDCPICGLRSKVIYDWPEDKLTSRLKALRK